MPHLQAFLIAFTLLPSLCLAVAPALVPPNGKAHGFISNIDSRYPNPPTGDWLTSTMCYCRSPVPPKEDNQYGKAHIFQHEYYNHRSNATFVLDHLCLARTAAEGDKCERPNIGGDNNNWIIDSLVPHEHVCKKFPRTEEEKALQGGSSTKVSKRQGHEPYACYFNCDPGPYGPDDPPGPSSHRDHDKVCFKTDYEYYGPGRTMKVKFNEQERTMDSHDKKTRVKTDFDEVQWYCEQMCQRTFNMPARTDKMKDKRADGGSRQFAYTKLEDMCDHCK